MSLRQFLFYTPLKFNEQQFREVNNKTKELASKFGFEYHSVYTKLTFLAYPYLKTELLQLANDWHLWLWVTDDFLDNPQIGSVRKLILLCECEKVLDGGEGNGSSPKLLGFLLDKLKPYLRISYLIKYIRKSLEAVRIKLKTKDWTPEKYLDVRYYESGWLMTHPFMFLGCNLDLEPLDFLKIKRIASDIIVLVNDYYSYEKDLKEKEGYNYWVLTNNDFIKVISEKYTEFKKHEGKSPFFEEKLKIWLDANLLWHENNIRYSSN